MGMLSKPFIWLNEAEERGVSDDDGVILVASYRDGGAAVFLGDIYAAAPLLQKYCQRLIEILDDICTINACKCDQKTLAEIAKIRQFVTPPESK